MKNACRENVGYLLRMYHDFFSRMATPKGEVSFTYLVGLVGLLEPWV